MTRFKDINDCLKAGIPMEVIRGCIDQAQDFAPKQVRAVADYESEFYEQWFGQELEPGLDLPFKFPFRIRESELTVWTGIEKSGKTTLLSYVLVCLMAQGERALITSYEIKPAKTLKKLSRQVYGGLIFHDPDRVREINGNPELMKEYRERAQVCAARTFRWMSRNLWMYDHVGIGNWRTLKDDIRWARRRYGIRQFVVDNFMRLGFVKDDYAQQAQCVEQFASLAMDLGVHIHLVVHQNKSNEGGKRSVSGAFEIIANAHNIVEVQRDETKGAKVGELFDQLKSGAIGQEQFMTKKAELDQKPDGKFILHAQRDGEQQNASRYLWFIWKAQQYCEHPPGHNEYGPISFLSKDDQAQAQVVATQADLPTEEPPWPSDEDAEGATTTTNDSESN